MPVTHVTVSSLAEFDAALSAALSSGAPAFSFFSGALNEDGVSWCPDCEEFKPLLKAVIEEAGAAGDLTLITAPLVRSEYKGVATHWARVHPKVMLRAIPTFIKWGASKKVAELVDPECKDVASVRTLVLDE